MSDARTNLEPPLPDSFGPFVHAGGRAASLSREILAVALLPALAGTILFGFRAPLILLLAASGGLLGEIVAASLTKRRTMPFWEMSVLAGLLVGLTLPADAPLGMPLLGGFVASAVGFGVFGGYGNHLWHPALIGRVATQLIYPGEFHPLTGTLLAKGHLLWGNLANHIPLPDLMDWRDATAPPGVDAWEIRSMLGPLLDLARGSANGSPSGDSPLLVVLRDELPDWSAAVLGLQHGGIGETCGVALLVAGAWLVFRGVMRWQLPLAMLLGAALAAAILPIRIGDHPALLPGLIVHEGVWLGGMYVAYHLVCGEILLCAMLLSADSVTTPLTRKGQIIFGLLVGMLTIILRVRGLDIGAGYWALLLLNTLVPVIDRWTKRRAVGT